MQLKPYFCTLALLCLSASAADIPYQTNASALALWGDAKALHVVAAPRSKKTKLVATPVAAVGTLGKGRLVAVSLQAPLRKDCSKAHAELAADWVRAASDKPAPRVAFFRVGTLSKHLAAAGLTGKSTRKIDAKTLKNADVLCVTWLRNDAERAAVEAFAKSGKGVVIFSCGVSRKTAVRDATANRLLSPAGISITNRNITAKYGGTIQPASADGVPKEIKLEAAFATLDAPAPKPVRRKRGQKKPVVKWESPRAHAVYTIQAAGPAVPRTSEFAKLYIALAKYGWTVVPPKNQRDPKAVNIEKNPRDYLAVVLLDAYLAKAPVERVKAHPAADVYPGAVPPSAKRITKTLDVDLSVPRWHTTGLYAAPGEVLTVTAPASVLGKNFKVRIGAHKDSNLRHETLQRFPHLTRSFEITKATTRAACSFGGTVYIEVPRGGNLSGTVKFTIAGGVAQPVFRRGMTAAQWAAELKHPAPWAEICGHKVILIVPTEMAKTVTQPEELMERWDRFLDLCAKVSGNDPAARTSPERLTGSLQISVGYLHSGYPAMGQYNHNLGLVDNDALSKDVPWGWYHELGHNHQNRDWTFTNGGEVTVNIFPLAGYNLLLKRPVSDNKRFGSKLGPGLKNYFSKTPTYKDFTSDVWLGLVFYYQIIEGFGWDNWFAVAKTYRGLSADQRPKTDQQKRDLFLEIYSKQVKRNLAPHFIAWGLEPSDAACEAVKTLPKWTHPEVLKHTK
ncbi:MAG: hypothetical protein HN370_08365 [Phycisphaerales bacterium]|jgi:hypothetical protein|nr:hypothetical protein [Phycisphaerales bacterium]